MKKNRGFIFALIGVTFTVLIGGYAAWLFVCKLSIMTVRVWMIVATCLIPIAAWAGWWFGHTEARGRLAGIDQAVDKVMMAATRTVGTRADARRQVQPTTVILPDVEIIQRPSLPGAQIIDL